jgi:hypothetical protein
MCVANWNRCRSALSSPSMLRPSWSMMVQIPSNFPAHARAAPTAVAHRCLSLCGGVLPAARVCTSLASSYLSSCCRRRCGATVACLSLCLCLRARAHPCVHVRVRTCGRDTGGETSSLSRARSLASHSGEIDSGRW